MRRKVVWITLLAAPLFGACSQELSEPELSQTLPACETVALQDSATHPHVKPTARLESPR